MKKRIIGVFPTIHVNETENPFEDHYAFSNEIIKSITKEAAIPFCFVLKEEKMIPEQLEQCDAFLLPGGSQIHPAAYELLDYAYKHKIPVLGICLGMQTLSIFSSLQNEPDRTPEKIKELENKVLQKIPNPNHKKITATRTNLEESKHQICIEPTSRLYTYIKKQIASVHSFHFYEVSHIEKLLKVTAFSEDGILEAVESNDPSWFALGVQFHPEFDSENLIIKGFINDIK